MISRRAPSRVFVRHGDIPSPCAAVLGAKFRRSFRVLCTHARQIEATVSWCPSANDQSGQGRLPTFRLNKRPKQRNMPALRLISRCVAARGRRRIWPPPNSLPSGHVLQRISLAISNDRRFVDRSGRRASASAHRRSQPQRAGQFHSAEGLDSPRWWCFPPTPPGRHVLIVGERRWRAAVLAGEKTVPALIRQCDPDEALEIQVFENLGLGMRVALEPRDMANAIQSIADRFETRDAAAEHFGRNASWLNQGDRRRQSVGEGQRVARFGKNLQRWRCRPIGKAGAEKTRSRRNP